MARPLQSTSSPSNNILLKVTVPKRTGRKRRKGTDEPFTGPVMPSGDATGDAASGSVPPRRNAEDLRRSLEDNVGRYQVETVGMVGRTHVFRGEFLSPIAVPVLVLIWIGIPDFVLSTTASPFTNRFRDQILSFDCKLLDSGEVSYTNPRRRENEAVRHQHGQRSYIQRGCHSTTIIQSLGYPIQLPVCALALY